MIQLDDVLYRMSHALVAHAARVAAPEQVKWIEAMAYELAHVPDRGAALSWALGCLFVSYVGRIRAMFRIPSNWPRWLTLLEMLICLGPVTAYFVLICVSTVQGYTLFLPTQGLTQIQEGLLFGSAALIGPVGLVCAWNTLFSHTRRGPSLSLVLGLLLAWALVACMALLGYLHLELAMWLGTYCLPFVLLPAAAVAHLAWLGSIKRQSMASA